MNPTCWAVTIFQETSTLSEPEALVSLFRALPGTKATVGLEAGPLSQWLYKFIRDADFEVVLLETRHVKGVLKAMPIKTDRRDAEGIARLLYMGWFRPVHCKSISAQEMRALLSSRRSLLDAAIKLELSVRGVLRNFGLKIGKISRIRFEARVRELTDGNVMLESAVAPILRARLELRNEASKIDSILRNIAKNDPICHLLMSMPANVDAGGRNNRFTDFQIRN